MIRRSISTPNGGTIRFSIIGRRIKIHSTLHAVTGNGNGYKRTKEK